uniref:Uncharacterized protein n=1 Tax=Anguilla anguilla TaxID=7936 RepID=A0A0E9TXN2_ANGAN
MKYQGFKLIVATLQQPTTLYNTLQYSTTPYST